MARFDDAKVGDRIVAPEIYNGFATLKKINNAETFTVDFDGKYQFSFYKDGRYYPYGKVPCAFYTNDDGDLLTGRPKRKVLKEWDVKVHGYHKSPNAHAITLYVSMLDFEKFKVTIGSHAKLTVEVEE